MRTQKQSQTSSLNQNSSRNTMGSTSRIHRNRSSLSYIGTGEKIENVLLIRSIKEKIRDEKKAWDIIRKLRDRCVKPKSYHPTNEELLEAINAFRTLWLLLPPIKRHKGERNKTFFIRTLHEVEEFRRVDMFAGDEGTK